MKYCCLVFISLVCISPSLAQESSTEKQIEVEALFSLTRSKDSHDTIRAAAFSSVSLLLYGENMDTLFSLNKEAIAIAEENLGHNLNEKENRAFTKILSEAHNNVGYYYQSVGVFKEALKHYLICIELDKRSTNIAGLSSTVNNMGMIFYAQGNIKKALKYFLVGLRLDEQLDQEEALIQPLNNIAYIYEHQEDLSKALIYYKKSLAISLKYGDKLNEGGVRINIGSALKKQHKLEEANGYFKQSLGIFQDLENKSGQASSLLNLGIIYLANNKIDSAQYYLEESLILYKEVSDMEGVAITLVSLGKIEFQKENFTKAQTQGEAALKIANQTANAYNIKSASKLLSQVYEKQQKGMLALDMHKRFIVMRDSANNITTQKTTIKQNMQYEFNKKEAIAVVEHQKELELNQAEKKKQQLIIWATSMGMVLIIVFAFISVRRLKVSIAQKRIIEQKNEENELLLGEIHHRVKNNLQVISSLLGLQERSINDASAKAAILEGKERVKSMGLIHKMLYQHDNYSGVEMDEYVPKLVRGLLSSFGVDETNFELDIDFSKLKLDVDTAIPVGLIINELVINSLKYAYENVNNPSLRLSLKEEDDKLLLEVSDNGKGKVDELNNSTSFGMKLVKSLSRQLGGTLIIKDDLGLTIQINITRYKLV